MLLLVHDLLSFNVNNNINKPLLIAIHFTGAVFLHLYHYPVTI